MSDKMIRLDVNHMMADMLGLQCGVNPAEVDALAGVRQARAGKRCRQARHGDARLDSELPYNQDEVVEKLIRVAAKVRENLMRLWCWASAAPRWARSAVHQALRPSALQ